MLRMQVWYFPRIEAWLLRGFFFFLFEVRLRAWEMGVLGLDLVVWGDSLMDVDVDVCRCV